MGLSSPWDDSLVIISLQTVKKWLGINPMGLINPWEDSPFVVSLQTTKIIV